MNLTDLFLAQLEREVPRNRHALEGVPMGKNDWKPHDKSMPLGRLALLVATIPSWMTMIVDQDSLDLKPAGGSSFSQEPAKTTAELVQAFEKSVEGARAALKATTDAHLMTSWKLLETGRVVMEQPRHVVLADTFMHMAHHRGQLTVYQRLCGAPVPAVYGPSADDAHFA